MSLNTDTTMQVVPAYGYGGGCGNNGMWGGDWIAWIVLLALLGGFGGRGFGFGGQGGCGPACATQADLAAGFNNSAVLSSLDDIKLGQAQAINYNNQGFSGLNTAILQGFHGVDNAVCNLGYQTQNGFNQLGAQLSDCCCKTQRAIDGVNYNLATQSCDTRNLIQNVTRDITDNANCNTRAILDFLVQSKMADKDARIAQLEGQVSRAEQTGLIRAAIDASTAEIRRYTGNECPVPSYWVQPPTPVQPPCSWTHPGYANYGGCGQNYAFAG